MSNWHAFIEDDEEENVCIYLQDGDNERTRELYDLVEADIKESESMVLQAQDYLEEAQEEAIRRNNEET